MSPPLIPALQPHHWSHNGDGAVSQIRRPIFRARTTLIRRKKNTPKFKHPNPLQKSMQNKLPYQSMGEPMRKNQHQNPNRRNKKLSTNIKMK